MVQLRNNTWTTKPLNIWEYLQECLYLPTTHGYCSKLAHVTAWYEYWSIISSTAIYTWATGIQCVSALSFQYGALAGKSLWILVWNTPNEEKHLCKRDSPMQYNEMHDLCAETDRYPPPVFGLHMSDHCTTIQQSASCKLVNIVVHL